MMNSNDAAFGLMNFMKVLMGPYMDVLMSGTATRESEEDTSGDITTTFEEIKSDECAPMLTASEFSE